MITREVGSKLLTRTPGSATNQRLMSSAMATKIAEKLAVLPQSPVREKVEDVVIEEVAIKPVHAAHPIQQVPGTQQPEHRHAEVVVEDHAASQGQVLLSMGGGGRCTTSPQESDNNRQAQSKQWCCTTSPQESDKHRQAQTKQRGVTTSPQESDNHRQAQSKQWGVTTDPQPEANGTKNATEEESAMYNQHTA